ncbi:MAG: tetratricopeptide repeat protein [Flavobacteriaceae bacterium]
MKNNLFFLFFLLLFGCVNTYAQSENYAKFYNKGNKFSKNNFEQAEKNYRTAIDDSLQDLRATYNLSNKYYNEELYDEAISRQLEATKLANNKLEKHSAYHNLGNSLMKKNMCSEAVMAFKNALRNNPEDDETRYNLALAKKCEEEQQNKDDENNDDENKDDENKDDENKDDENKDDENKDDENKDDENKDDENKDDENKDDENKDKENKDKENKDKENNKKQNDNQQSKLSPQQINNLLKAMENAEKKVQAKVNDKKQKGMKVVSEKDW